MISLTDHPTWRHHAMPPECNGIQGSERQLSLFPVVPVAKENTCPHTSAFKISRFMKWSDIWNWYKLVLWGCSSTFQVFRNIPGTPWEKTCPTVLLYWNDLEPRGQGGHGERARGSVGGPLRHCKRWIRSWRELKQNGGFPGIGVPQSSSI